MGADSVRIDEMRLNISGLGQEDANILGRDVIRRVGKKLPERIRSRRLTSLDVKVSVSQGTPKERLAEIIAEQICKSLI